MITTIRLLAQAYQPLTDEQKEMIHSVHRDEYGQELPYFRDGATPEMVATALVVGAPYVMDIYLELTTLQEAQAFWAGYNPEEPA